MEKPLIISTTNTLEGYNIREYKGIVTGEAIPGANIVRAFFAGIRDIVGGRSGACEKELRKTREHAFSEMREQAAEPGADAIAGVDIDSETLGENDGMLMVTAAGTAVRPG